MLTRADALGDWLAAQAVRFQGTKEFLGLHLIWWLTWWALDLPVDLLTLWVSLEAIVQTSLVAMAQRSLSEHVRDQNVQNVQIAQSTCRHCSRELNP